MQDPRAKQAMYMSMKPVSFSLGLPMLWRVIALGVLTLGAAWIAITMLGG